MKLLAVYLIVGALIAATLVECSSVRTRANTLRVSRVRRIDDAAGDE